MASLLTITLSTWLLQHTSKSTDKWDQAVSGEKPLEFKTGGREGESCFNAAVSLFLWGKSGVGWWDMENGWRSYFLRGG